MRSEISKVKAVFERTFAPHCSSGLFVLKLHPLHHAGKDLKRLGSSWFTDAMPLGQFNELIEQSYRMTARQYSTRLYETVRIMSKVLEKAPREEAQVHVGPASAFFLKKRKCVKGVVGVSCER